MTTVAEDLAQQLILTETAAAAARTTTKYLVTPIYNVTGYGADKTGVTDSTTAFKDAIAAAKAAGGGRVYVPYGIYKISETLTVDDTIFIESDGATLSWYGGALPMLTVGGNVAEVLYRLGVAGLTLDGRGLATIGLNVLDLQDARFRYLLIKDCITNGVYISNTTGLGHPTGFLRVEDLKIQLRNGLSPTANGIYIDGKSSGGSEGVTLSKFDDIRIEHANGDGVVFGDYGDNMIFNRLFTWRADTETGIGVHYVSTIQGNVSNTTFINPLLSSGLKVDTPNYAANHGIYVVNICASSGDLNTGVTLPIYGPGSIDVSGFDSMGRTYGMDRVGCGKEVATADRFKFMNYDVANQFLYTSDGMWKTAISGGNLLNEGDDGSSCTLVTQNATNNIAAIYDCATLGASGVQAVKNPTMMIEVAAIDTADALYRFGFADAVTDPPTNGIYVEGTAAGNWKVVCRKAGTETAVDTFIAIIVQRRIWLIDVKNNLVIFYSRLPSEEYFTYVTSIATNIPTVALDTVILVKALANDATDLRLFNYALRHGLE